MDIDPDIGFLAITTLIGVVLGLTTALIIYFFVGAGGWIFICIIIPALAGGLYGAYSLAIYYL